MENGSEKNQISESKSSSMVGDLWRAGKEVWDWSGEMKEDLPWPAWGYNDLERGLIPLKGECCVAN